MKKFLAILLVIFMLCCSSIMAFATGDTTYEIDDLHMKITVPGDWITFEQQVAENDPNLALVNRESGTELTTYYKQNNIYLNTLQLDPLTEIVVTMIEYDGSRQIKDFQNFKEEALQEMADSLMSADSVQDSIINYSDYWVYSNAQASYIVLTGTMDNSVNVADCKQYYTIKNGQAINITLYSYEEKISPSISDLQQKMVDSIVFTVVDSSNNNGLGEVFENAQDFAKSNLGFLLVVGILFVIIIVAVIVIILIVLNKNKHKSAQLPADDTFSSLEEKKDEKDYHGPDLE